MGPERAGALHARSGGHPLFLVQLAAADHADELPATIREAVMARAAALGPVAAALVTAASVLGPEIDLDLLADVLARPAGELLDQLEAAAEARLLEERGGGFVFRHALVREALAEGATAARRSWLHREAARVLAARPRRDPLAVAWHARRGGDVEAASAALVTAAALAEARYDGAEAERLLDEALVLVDTVPGRLARARVRMARLEMDAAEEDAQQALALGVGPEGLELAGWVAYYRRDWDGALRRAEEGISRAGGSAVRASCLALAGRIRHSRGDLAAADAHLAQALATAPPELRGVAQVWLAGLRNHQGRPGEAVDLAGRGLVDPDHLGHPFAVSTASTPGRSASL